MNSFELNRLSILKEKIEKYLDLSNLANNPIEDETKKLFLLDKINSERSLLINQVMNLISGQSITNEFVLNSFNFQQQFLIRNLTIDTPDLMSNKKKSNLIYRNKIKKKINQKRKLKRFANLISDQTKNISNQKMN